MHEPFLSTQLGGPRARGRRFLDAARDYIVDHRVFFYTVVLPTLAVALYMFGVAADQYESEAHFLVRSADSSSSQQMDGVGQVLGFIGGGGAGTSHSEAMSVGDYLTSHDAVAALRKRANLVELFRRPEADIFSRLHSARPAAETLEKYYRSHVEVNFADTTGIATLKVRTFRPADSYLIINALLSLGEQRVNALNQRLYQSTLGVARDQLTQAEESLSRAQAEMTHYRQGQRDIDPKATGTAQITMVSQLQEQLAVARAQESAMAATVQSDSPQLVALRQRVAALEAQVNAQSGRLTAGGDSIAAGLGGYQALELRQEFASKRYDAAAAALEHAREQMEKQQLFIVRVVEPNMPEKSLYPHRWKVVLTAFLGLLLSYGIGWLIVAGVREHAA